MTSLNHRGATDLRLIRAYNASSISTAALKLDGEKREKKKIRKKTHTTLFCECTWQSKQQVQPTQLKKKRRRKKRMEVKYANNFGH